MSNLTYDIIELFGVLLSQYTIVSTLFGRSVTSSTDII